MKRVSIDVSQEARINAGFGYAPPMLGLTHDAPAFLDRAAEIMRQLDAAAMQRLADAIVRRYERDRAVFVIGNGGSALTASHFAEDLGTASVPNELRHDVDRRRVRAMALTDNVGWITAAANDLGYEHVFTQQLVNHARPGDLLVAISGSGQSPNILQAVDWANAHGVDTFGVTGFTGGELRTLQRDGLHLACDDMGVVESMHLLLFHWVLGEVHGRIHGRGRHG